MIEYGAALPVDVCQEGNTSSTDREFAEKGERAMTLPMLRTADILGRRDAERLITELAALRAAVESLTDRLTEYKPPVIIQEAADQRLGISREEAAEALAISADLLDDLIRSGVIPHRRVGKRVIVSRRALQMWIDADETATPKPARPTGYTHQTKTGR